MTTTSRASALMSGVLGGLVVLIAGAVLIATDVIETGDTKPSDARQQPLTRPVADGGGGRDDAEGSTVAEIYDRVKDGVVFIAADGGGERNSPFGLPQRQGPRTGSGFVIDRQGFIVTNAHVVEGADEVLVRFQEDDTPVEAKLVGDDLSTDTAVLKVDPSDAPLSPLELGSSKDIKVGDPAIAIGNPFGFDRTVTTGIVSALQRQIEAPNGFGIDNVIQTDASINPGNSGGPLLDADGRVIGINSQIATGGSQGSVGIGFAVPVDTVKTVIPQLKRNGKVERAYLGITTSPVTAELAREADLPAKQGALVQEVADDGPADDAGLRGGTRETTAGITLGGDLVVKVDGVDIKSPDDIVTAIADNKPGDRVSVEYFRGDDRETVAIKLGSRPNSLDAARRAQPPDEDDSAPFPLP